MADKMFYRDGEAEFRYWTYAEPDNYGSKEHCASFSHTGHWHDISCEKATPAVCFDVRGKNSDHRP